MSRVKLKSFPGTFQGKKKLPPKSARYPFVQTTSNTFCSCLDLQPLSRLTHIIFVQSVLYLLLSLNEDLIPRQQSDTLNRESATCPARGIGE
jgi:hypothetical protein